MLGGLAELFSTIGTLAEVIEAKAEVFELLGP